LQCRKPVTVPPTRKMRRCDRHHIISDLPRRLERRGRPSRRKGARGNATARRKPSVTPPARTGRGYSAYGGGARPTADTRP
jgi:hypothetical protein